MERNLRAQRLAHACASECRTRFIIFRTEKFIISAVHTGPCSHRLRDWITVGSISEINNFLAPAWPTTLLNGFLSGKTSASKIVRDVDATVLDNFSQQLGNKKFALCVTQENGLFSAYAAVNKSMLHKPREENLRDYRLGPDVHGLLSQISIALLPDEQDETTKSKLRSARGDLLEDSQKFFSRLGGIFTFGGTGSQETVVPARQNSSKSSRTEKLLVDTARVIKKKLCERELVLVWPGMHISTGGQRVIVTDVYVQGGDFDKAMHCGFATKSTSVLPDLEDPGEFTKVQVCPFLDTIPQTYDVDLFQDALSPYFAKNPLEIFAQGDSFKYNTIEFKIVSTEPPSLPKRLPLDRVIGKMTEELPAIVPANTKKQRVGPSTLVSLGYPILPHWIDILPPDKQHIVMSLPTPFESIMLLQCVSESAPSAIERVMNATEAMKGPSISPAKKAKDLAGAMQQLRIDVTDTMREDGLCTVCLGEFTPKEEVIKLECSHVFHLACLSNWLVRTKACPLCKASVTDLDLAASRREDSKEGNISSEAAG